MPATGPITDDTGQQIVAALNALTAAITASTAQLATLTKELSDIGDTVDLMLADAQQKALCLQNGWTYTPPAYNGG